MRLDNEARKLFAKLVIDREVMVEYVRDVKSQLPNIDLILKRASEAYVKDVEKFAKLEEDLDSLVSELLRLEKRIEAIDKYKGRLAVFETGSKIANQIASWRENVPKAIGDAYRLEDLSENPAGEFQSHPVTVKMVDDEWVEKYNEVSSKLERMARKAYTDFDSKGNADKYDRMNAILRENDFEVLREVYARVLADTVGVRGWSR